MDLDPEGINKRKLASYINETIDHFIKHGRPSEEELEARCNKLEELIDALSASVEDAMDSLKSYTDELYDDLMEHKGFKAISLVGDEHAIKKFAFGSDWDAAVQKIDALYSEMMSAAFNDANSLKNSNNSAALTNFREWARSFPEHPTKDKEEIARKRHVARDIRSDLKSASDWMGDFSIAYYRATLSALNVLQKKMSHSGFIGVKRRRWERCAGPVHGDEQYFFFENSAAIKGDLIDINKINFYEIDKPYLVPCGCAFDVITLEGIPTDVLTEKGRRSLDAMNDRTEKTSGLIKTVTTDKGIEIQLTDKATQLMEHMEKAIKLHEGGTQEEIKPSGISGFFKSLLHRK